VKGRIAIGLICAAYFLSFLTAMAVWGNSAAAVILIVVLWGGGLIYLATNDRVERWLNSLDDK
jgi:hypothetical protein